MRQPEIPALIERVRGHLAGIPLGQPFTSAHLRHLGHRAAMNRALSRLTQAGDLVRVARGVYVNPRRSKILGAVLPGALEVAQAVAESRGVRIAYHGEAWALRFGLTTQVMVSPTYLTDGPTRRIRLGKSLVTLRHASSRLMRLAESQAGRAILALEWLGEPASPETAMGKVWAALSESEWGEFLTEADLAGGWVARFAKVWSGRPTTVRIDASTYPESGHETGKRVKRALNRS